MAGYDRLKHYRYRFGLLLAQPKINGACAEVLLTDKIHFQYQSGVEIPLQRAQVENNALGSLNIRILT